MSESSYHPWLHRIALLTACATFPLIFMGGLVTSHQAGMSVPDWPNSYGYNMFLFPPRLWIGGILYEHTHRLMGTVVGFLSMALVATAWRTEIGFAFRWIWSTIIAALRPHLRWLSIPPSTPPIRLPSAVERHLRWLAFSVLAAVLFQGILGGLRVVLVKLDLAIVHACVAQAFFCLVTLVAIITSKWWQSVQRSSFSVQRSLPPVDFLSGLPGVLHHLPPTHRRRPDAPPRSRPRHPRHSVRLRPSPPPHHDH